MMKKSKQCHGMQGWALVLFCALISGAWAQATLGPREQVIETSKQILDVLRARREALQADSSLIYGYINEILLPHFDFARMARSVLGKHWRRASNDQRRRFIAEFQNLLVRTYGTALLEYTNQKIVYLPLRTSATHTRVTVRTEIRPPGGFPIPVNYGMYQRKSGWEVYDVIIDGVSLVTNYRSSFSQDIQRYGLNYLIGKLAERNRKGGQ